MNIDPFVEEHQPIRFAVGYKVFAQKDEPTQINETVLLINDANKSVEEADHTIEKANASFQKIPLNEYKPDNSTLQASQ
ncbi:hypothetical protein [Acinetobacter baumannii]|uniref:hypothetical protein n=1 Tax=Acinetobacter baumannii TaxID=470 RepID=UPI0021F06A36